MIDMNKLHLCLICNKNNVKINEWSSGPGDSIVTTCPDCGSIGHIGNSKPFRGIALTEIELSGIFAIANIKVIHKWKLPNQYWSEPTAHHWWLVKTVYGLIEIGWRKRVLSINWSDTTVRALISSDNVTKSETGIHANSLEKAIEYMKTWNVSAQNGKLQESSVSG